MGPAPDPLTDAVFNEGRYYRLVVKSGGTIAGASAPERALLWRPRLMAGSSEVCILRDDDAVLCSPNFASGAFLRDVVTFVTDGSRPCALHSDAGVTCIVSGVEQQVMLPPVTELVGNSRLCGRTASGWVCAGQGAPAVNELGSIFSSNRGGTLCGRSNIDGGARCFSSSPGPGTIELGDVEFVGLSENQLCAIADGGVQCLELTNQGFASPLPASLPPTSVPYVDLAVTGAHYGFCVRQSDGHVRCSAEWGTYWGTNPPLSAEPFEQWVLSSYQPMSFGCGLTAEHRLRCGGERFTQLPPTQPVRQVQVGTGSFGVYFLLENGRLAGRGRMQAYRGPSPDDRFTQIATALGTAENVCGLRADGTVLCWSWSATEPQPQAGKRYVSIGMSLFASCGLETDNTISCWRGGWVPTGNYERLMTIDGALCGQRADGSLSCDRAISPPLPLGVRFRKVASNGSTGCGIRLDGHLECWPGAAPSSTLGRRFVDMSTAPSSPNFCAVAEDGEVSCWGGFLPSPVWRDFTSVTVGNSMACGLRTDQTASCWPLLGNWTFGP